MRGVARELVLLRRGEKAALLVLALILILSLVLRIRVSHLPTSGKTTDSLFIIAVGQLRQELDSLDNLNSAFIPFDEHSELLFALEPFNPNTVSGDELQDMHLPERVIRNLLKYRSAGGVFYKKEDLRKIYGLDSAAYAEIFQFITIPELKEVPEVNYAARPAIHDFRTEKEIEINSADSMILESIGGIGPVFSERIKKYGHLLGGYYHFEQFWEVYGMDSQKYASLSKSVVIDTLLINRLNINTATFRQLLSHPYLNREEVVSLIHYRDYIEYISDLKELYEMEILDSVCYQRIKPYLEIGIH